MSSSYHPQIDGQTEVVNRTLEQYLRCFAGDQPRKWMDWLPWAEFSYNTNLHTKTTSFEVVYGVPPPGLLPYVPRTTRVQTVEEYLRDRTAVIKELRHHLTLAQKRMKKQANRSQREVYSMKLSPRFFGPFEILEKIGQVAYCLALLPGAQIHDVVHVSLLRKLLGDRPPALLSLPPVLDEPRTKVLVRWAGASMKEATWENLWRFSRTYPEFTLADKDTLGREK
ncbi:hypothetical protein ACOSQ2_027892 [Xanthoceras sorbifolium]